MTAPVRREVLLSATPERAFDLFVGHIGQWWPLAKFSVFGDGTVSFEHDIIVERRGDEQSVWGEVTTWSPPGEIAFTWHPGYDAGNATDVRVTFEPQDDKTLVTLVHTGWERMTDPDASADGYRTGWPGVLAGFAALVDA